MLGIIFSRDRAMQLDGTLRSFLLHCHDPEEASLFVIYKTTNPNHVQQYAQLAREYAGKDFIHFIEQKNFRKDLLNLLVQHATDRPAGTFYRLVIEFGARFGFLNNLRLDFDQERYVLFLVDDNIFIRDFSLREVCENLANHTDAIGFSLRLGTNTTYCYPLDKSQSLPSFTKLAKCELKFNWTAAEGDFGYPLEVSSSVYRLNEMLPLLNQLSFKNPNILEVRIAANARTFRKKKPYLLCYEQSVTFCDPINKVQTIAANRAGSKLEYSSDQLALMFDDDFRINVEAYKGFVPTACHQEKELSFKKITRH